MKKVISIIKSYVGHAGAYFLFSILPFALLASATELAVDPLLIWSSLLFGALVALCDFLFVLPLIQSYLVNIFLHGILTVGSFAITLGAATKKINMTGQGGRTAVFGVMLFSVLYIILATIRCVYHFATTKKENSEKAYESLYTPKDID
jgi:hypothetical protein